MAGMAVDEEGEGGAPPLLLISHGQHLEKQSLYSVWENRFHTTSIPLLPFKIIVNCGYGWVVLLDTLDIHANNCCLWNPISMESIQLPHLERPSRYRHCILTHPPTQSDSHILFNNQLDFELIYCKIGDEAYTTQELEDGLLAIGVFRERIYGVVGENYDLVNIDIEYSSDENKNKLGRRVEFRPLFELGNLNISSRPFHNICSGDVYMVSCDDDELFLVYTARFKRYCDFRVFRLDLESMELLEVGDIGGRTIFLLHSLDVGFCCKSNKVRRNCIYYSEEGYFGGRRLHIYNLEDKSTTLLLPSPSLERCDSMSFWLPNQLCRHFFSQS